MCKSICVLVGFDHSEDKMNQVPSTGECLPEDINKMDEQKSCDSTESSDTGQDIHFDAEK